MDWSEASMIFGELSHAATQSPQVDSVFRELGHAAVRYARLRTDWTLIATEQNAGFDATDRADLDGRRRRAHNLFIDACSILVRNMRSSDLPVDWRKKLGDHRSGEGRKRIRNFACYVHCFPGLSAR